MMRRIVCVLASVSVAVSVPVVSPPVVSPPPPVSPSSSSSSSGGGTREDQSKVSLVFPKSVSAEGSAEPSIQTLEVS